MVRLRKLKLKEEDEGDADGINLRSKSAKQIIREIKAQENASTAKFERRVPEHAHQIKVMDASYGEHRTPLKLIRF